jgi:hypothetical protein
MLTGVMVMPQLVAVRPVSFRPTPYDWVPLAVLILLIVIFVWVYSGGGRFRGGRRTGPGGGLYAVPVACQDEAGITDIKRYSDDDRTGRDQECSS